MIYLEPKEAMLSRMDDLLREAAQARLAAKLAHQRHTRVRHELATACLRLARWLDGEASPAHATQSGYLRRDDSGPSDWVTRSASV